MQNESSPANAAPNPARSAFGVGCAILFALPFVGAGLFMWTMAARDFGGQNAPASIFLAIMGTVFAMAGGGVVGAVIYAYRKERLEQARRAAAPDAPWLWRDDWASGYSKTESTGGAIGLVIFAVFWDLISFPIGYFVFTQWRDGRAAAPALIAMLFPILGIFLLWGALVKLGQQVRFGRTRLLLNGVPLRMGSSARVELEAPPSLGTADTIKILLSNIKEEVTGSGKSRSRRDVVLWQVEHEMLRPQFTPGPNGPTLPLTFGLPSDGEVTRKISGDLRYLWRLDLTASLAGPDFEARFELPVFERGTSTASPSAAMFGTTDTVPTRPANCETIIDPQLGNILRLTPGVLRRGGFGIMLFGLFFAAIGAIAAVAGASLAFPIVFGLIGLLVAYFGYDTMVGRTDLVVTERTLTVRRNNGLRATERVFEPEQLSRMSPKVVGSINGRAIYGVAAYGSDGREYALCSSLTDQSEARWIIAELERLLDRDLSPENT